MKILNLTQHVATPEQIAQGVVNPADHAAVKAALTFEELPSSAVLTARAETLAMFAAQQGCKTALIGGAPYFMGPLERALWDKGIRPLYAFSVRETEEVAQPDGSVRKIAVFRHAGFVGTEFAEIPSPMTLDELNKLTEMAFQHGYAGGAPYQYLSLADAKESATG